MGIKNFISEFQDYFFVKRSLLESLDEDKLSSSNIEITLKQTEQIINDFKQELEFLDKETKPIPTNMLNLIYPLGTIYSNGEDGRDPKEIFSWPQSSWRRYGPGRSIMAATGAGATTSPWLTVPSDLKMILGPCLS